jgi:ABC-2 type transport system ATP-binding protein
MREASSQAHAAMGIVSRGISKDFGVRKAVDGLEFSVPEGSMLALLGPNGAGKTSAVRMLSGQLAMSSGSATVLGLDLETQWRRIKENCGVAPQESAVAERLSARENLMLMAGSYGMLPAEAKKRCEKLLADMGLEDRALSQARTLSGGLKRRLSLAMALVSGPRLLFLDEPSLGLDPQARRSLWSAIAALKGKATIVLTTHYLEEAEALADRVIIMKDGRIVAEGSPAELRDRVGGVSRVVAECGALSLGIQAELAQAFPGIRIEGASLSLECGNDGALLLLDGLRARGLSIARFSVEKPGLDEAYLALLKEEE